MIVGPVIGSGAPGAAGILAGAFLWVLSMLILLFHRSGMQVLGGTIAMMGLMMMMVNTHLLISLTLLVFGFGVHGCGRLLLHMRRRQ